MSYRMNRRAYAETFGLTVGDCAERTAGGDRKINGYSRLWR